MAMNKAEILELAARVDTFNTKLRRIIGLDDAALSASGKATAIAMLATMNTDTFDQVATSLRAIAEGGE